MKDFPKLTRFIARPGDAVWVKMGIGECAAKIIVIKRDHAVVKFVTGSREKAEWSAMRFRREEAR